MVDRRFKEEVEWMEKLVEVHPILRKLPQRIKSKLAVQPGSWSELPANRRTRKRLQRDGFIAHLFSGCWLHTSSSVAPTGRGWPLTPGD